MENSETITSWFSSYHRIKWCALVVLEFDGRRWTVRHSMIQLPYDLAMTQWHISGPIEQLKSTARIYHSHNNNLHFNRQLEHFTVKLQTTGRPLWAEHEWGRINHVRKFSLIEMLIFGIPYGIFSRAFQNNAQWLLQFCSYLGWLP